MHAHIFLLCYFSIFSIFLGAGLDPASPAWSLAQASDPAGQKSKKARVK